jgi:hypothetical protein
MNGATAGSSNSDEAWKEIAVQSEPRGHQGRSQTLAAGQALLDEPALAVLDIYFVSFQPVSSATSPLLPRYWS